jgi:hypothetical protein
MTDPALDVGAEVVVESRRHLTHAPAARGMRLALGQSMTEALKL